jgi:hypothetical protein
VAPSVGQTVIIVTSFSVAGATPAMAVDMRGISLSKTVCSDSIQTRRLAKLSPNG